MASAIVEATAHFADAEHVAKVSRGLGEAMRGLDESAVRRASRRPGVVAGPSVLSVRGRGGPLIGVLDLQGDVREHLAALAEVGCSARPVKRPEDLEGLAGLVLPGGESTTLSMLLESTGSVRRDGGPPRGAGPPGLPGRSGLPLFGTCAGLVLVAREVLDGRPDQRTFGVLDAVVRRNGYGRQMQSFEADVVLGSGESPPLPAVFIRAPVVASVGDDVEVLAVLDGVPVLVRQGPVLASSFHPELTPDRRVHRLFAEMCVAGDGAGGDSDGAGSARGIFG